MAQQKPAVPNGWPKVQVVFYTTPTGKEVVREWLKSNVFSADERRSIGEDIKTVQFGWPIGMPLVEKLSANLWEVRTKLPNRIVRVFFTTLPTCIVLVHGIVKKDMKIPLTDLRTAQKRANDVRSYHDQKAAH